MVKKFNLNSLLSDTSLGSEGSKKVKDKFKVTSISVLDLIPSGGNFYSVEDIEELKDSIEMFGIKQNLTVKPLENEKYMIISGHRRHLSSLKLLEEGKKEFEFLPCVIETELDEIKEQLLLITTNSTARQLTDWEKTQQAEKMRELLERYKKKEKLPGRIRELVAKSLNTSTTQIGRMESISKHLTDDFKEEFKEQNINISTAYEISTLPEETQKEILKDYAESGSVSIKDVKEKKAQKKLESKENIVTQDPSIKSMFEILKGMDIEDLAEFICYRCNGLGRFCDLAIECNESESEKRIGICIRWLKTQAQKRG